MRAIPLALLAVLAVLALPAGCRKKDPEPAKPLAETAPAATPVPVAEATPIATASPLSDSGPAPEGPRVRDPLNQFLLRLGLGGTAPATSPAAVARRAIDGITEQDERALGQAAAVDIIRRTGGLLLDDALLLRYVNRVGNLVAQQGARRPTRIDGTPRTQSRDFVFGILDDDATLNAFSTPGGYVFVTSGLLRDIGSESELAWVLGHEVAHIDQEHGLRALKYYVSQKAFTSSLVEGLGGAPIDWRNPRFFASMSARLADVSGRLYGRLEEREADKIGLEYAVEAGYDANGGPRLLQTLGEGSKTRLSPFVTHDAPYARKLVLDPFASQARSRPGYAGRVGAARFTRECIDRLDGARSASASAAPR